MPRPGFAIFEGGGAKGIAHIGALHVVESYGFELQGVAGTSAGSLVAALIAAGYDSNEIMRVRGATLEHHILAELALTPVDLLGRTGWPRVERLRYGGFAAGLIWLAVVALTLIAFPHVVAYEGIGFYLPATFALLAMLCPAWVKLGALVWATGRFARRRGLLHTGEVAKAVNAILHGKLTERAEALRSASGVAAPVPDMIRFADIEALGLCPLRIIATPVGGDAPAVFGGPGTREVVVAEAVAASVAIPGLFSPVQIPSFDPDLLFVDGGMMANLPAWVFAEEKLMFERRNPDAGRVPILAFTLDDTEAPQGPAGRRVDSGVVAFLGDVVRAGIFGSQRPVERFVEDLYLVPIRTSLGTLDFTAGPDAAVNANQQGRQSAFAHLGPHFAPDPGVSIVAELAAYGNFARSAITSGARADPPPNVRFCVVEREGNFSFRVAYTDGMQLHADDRLPLDRDNPGAPSVFHDGKPNFWLVEGDPGQNLFMTKYEKILVWSELKSVIAIPILSNGAVIWNPGLNPGGGLPVIAALCIDSDVDLAFMYNDLGFMERIGTAAAGLAGLLAGFHKIRRRSR